MDERKEKIRSRLYSIWQPPDFASFFRTYAKRPPQKIKKGTILFNEGDQLERLYFIQEGFVKLYRLSEQGRESTIYLHGPGYILGIRALTSKDSSARHTAEAITDCVIRTIARKDFFDIASQHPEVLLDLLAVFIDRLNYTERKLEGFILTDTIARVANFLLECAQRFGKPASTNKNEKQILLPLPLTHQRIGEFVGAFRETVTVALNKLTHEGILTAERGQVTILDLEKLKTHALSS